MILPAVAFIIAALLGFLQAVEAEFGGVHKIDWAVCALGVGLALWVLAVGPSWQRRGP